jgi:hypothetical protein
MEIISLESSDREMMEVRIGHRFRKAGDRAHFWAVDGLIAAKTGVPAYAILVSGDELQVEQVDLSHLEDSEQFIKIP